MTSVHTKQCSLIRPKKILKKDCENKYLFLSKFYGKVGIISWLLFQIFRLRHIGHWNTQVSGVVFCKPIFFSNKKKSSSLAFFNKMNQSICTILSFILCCVPQPLCMSCLAILYWYHFLYLFVVIIQDGKWQSEQGASSK